MEINDELTLANLDIEDPELEDGELSPEEQNFGTVDEPKEWLDNGYMNPSPEPTPDNNQGGQEEEGLDVLTALLNQKGISDPSKIKFADDEGNIQERSWDDLTAEEQFNILSTPQTNSETDLDESEIELINNLRLRGISPEEYENMLIQQGMEQASQSQEPVYEIDSIPDDELFVLDLQTRSEDMTEDDLANALEQAKANPELYRKQISGIREEYRKLEQEEIQQRQTLDEAEKAEEMRQFQDNILGNIDNLTSIGDLNIELSDEDKNELAEFILGRDGAGVSYLGKALNDGETLTKMAWFALHGEEMLDNIQDYFADQITKARESGYKEGLAAAKSGKKTPDVVVRKPAKQPAYFNNTQEINDITQLD